MSVSRTPLYSLEYSALATSFEADEPAVRRERAESSATLRPINKTRTTFRKVSGLVPRKRRAPIETPISTIGDEHRPTPQDLGRDQALRCEHRRPERVRAEKEGDDRGTANGRTNRRRKIEQDDRRAHDGHAAIEKPGHETDPQGRRGPRHRLQSGLSPPRRSRLAWRCRFRRAGSPGSARINTCSLAITVATPGDAVTMAAFATSVRCLGHCRCEAT
jgi:hypothetical protein